MLSLLIKSIINRKDMITEDSKPIFSSGANYVLSFIGGFLGAMTHYINSLTVLLQINIRELIDFTIHSLIGGVIMLGVKVTSDWLLHKIKRGKKNE